MVNPPGMAAAGAQVLARPAAPAPPRCLSSCPAVCLPAAPRAGPRLARPHPARRPTPPPTSWMRRWSLLRSTSRPGGRTTLLSWRS